jgi:putative ABC transport system permease protein
MVPRAMWRRAPLALIRRPAIFVAVASASLLAALAASSGPLGRAGIESEALKGKLAALTPLAAGLTIERSGGSSNDSAAGIGRADRARRAAAVRLAETLPATGAPVLTSSTFATLGGKGFEGNGVDVVPMARDGATRHVQRIAGSGAGAGAWVSSALTHTPGIRAGGTLTLVDSRFDAATGAPPLKLPIAAVYRQLDTDLGNPYWVNFVLRIRPRTADSPLQPTFVLTDRATVYTVAHSLSFGSVSNVYELPVDAHHMTPAVAKRSALAYADVRRSLSRPTALARALGCGGRLGRCRVTSSLTSAVIVARESAAALTSIVVLLTGLAVLLAVGSALVAGVFGARQRAAEGRLSLAGGESRLAFAVRAAFEACLPALLGGLLGTLAAIELLRLFTPNGTVDRGVVLRAVVVAGVSVLVAIAAVAGGATMARGRLGERRRHRLLPRVWWEGPTLVAGAVGYAAVVHGGGLVGEKGSGGSHPRLVVFVIPLLVAAGLTGVAARGLRVLLARRTAPRSTAGFLATRRLAAARALPLVLTVTAAVSVCALAFAEILSTSLHENSAEKAYVANGADVQGYIDAGETLPATFPYPLTKVLETFNSARLDDASGQVEMLAVDVPSLRRVLRWRWAGDPQGALRMLAESTDALPVVAVGAHVGAHRLFIAGGELPVRVVATLPAFPGMTASEPLLIVSADRLNRAARAASLGDPLEDASAYVWARGPPPIVERALARSRLEPLYLTSVDDFLNRDELTIGERAYSFLRVIALGAAVLALVALLLYLRARSRTQLLTSRLMSRMGIRMSQQAAATAVEGAALIAFASIVGIAAALATAAELIGRVDPLPAYPPSVAAQVPWTLLGLSCLAVVLLAAALGALATVTAGGDVEEALRVA